MIGCGVKVMADRPKVYAMKFAKVYRLLVAKALKKGRSEDEVQSVIHWLTGYDRTGVEEAITANWSYEEFFRNAPQLNPGRNRISGTICGVRIEQIGEPLMREIRYLDKLIDELARGKCLSKILFEND